MTVGVWIDVAILKWLFWYWDNFMSPKLLNFQLVFLLRNMQTLGKTTRDEGELKDEESVKHDFDDMKQ